MVGRDRDDGFGNLALVGLGGGGIGLGGGAWVFLIALILLTSFLVHVGIPVFGSVCCFDNGRAAAAQGGWRGWCMDLMGIRSGRMFCVSGPL